MKLIRENAITDLRRELQGVDLTPLDDKKAIDYYHTKYTFSDYGRPKAYRGDPKFSDKSVKERLFMWIENLFRQKLDFDFNAQDLNLVKISKPKGPTVAKRSPNMLIGISTATGDAVVIGKDQFFAYFSGETGSGRSNSYGNRAPEDPRPTWDNKNRQVSLRDIWDRLDLWFEIVEGADYTPRSEISKGRRDDTFVSYNSDADHNRDMKRKIFYSELDLYDPQEARRKYSRRLKQSKYRKQYEAILSDVESLNDRIRSIDFGHPILGGGKQYEERFVKALRSAYVDDLKYYLDHLNSDIENERDWSIDTYQEHCKDAIERIDRILTNNFNV